MRSTTNSSGPSLYGCAQENPAGRSSLPQGSRSGTEAASVAILAPSAPLRSGGAEPARPRAVSDRLAH